MKQFLCTVGLVLLILGARGQTNITAMEYYLDVDPGHGNGTSIAVTPGVLQDLNFSIPTGSLSAGFHTIYIRSEDANGAWSHPERRPFFVSQSTTEARTNISAVEYFLDVDPGHGNGISVAVTPSTDVDLIEQIPTGSLTPGFHTVYFRVQDAAGQWSATEHEPFFISQSTTEARTNISAVEYFLDVEPGHGNGISVAVTPSTDIDLIEQIPTGSLTPGFHTVYFRVQDAAGQWSATEREPFFISQSTTEARIDISAIEYFLDVDPGHGNGISVAVTPSTDIDLIEQIPTSSLTPGFHTVYFRVQDAAGQWSTTEQEPFFISQSTTEVRTNISAVEYFLDVDPGHGNGISVIVTPSTDIDLIEQIPTGSLTPGFHTVYFRVQDAVGQWSATEHEPFFISQSTTEVRTDISAVEYFLDVDPGHGNGIAVAVAPSTDIDLIEQIPTSSLTPGFHTVYFRVQDTAGQWSATEHEPFFISQSTTEVRTNISAVEYFLDVDPGHGNGISVIVTPSTDIDLLEQIPTSSLTSGFHTVYFRVQDASGQWSATEHQPFYIDRLRKIQLVEYAFDSDPGVSNATPVAVNPALSTIDQVITASEASSLSVGPHDLYVRVQDDIQAWSVTSLVNFNVCEGAIADFSIGALNCVGTAIDFLDLSAATEAGDVYSWDFDGDGSEDDNTVGDVTFTYSTGGTYDVTLTVDRLGCISTVTKTVTVNELPTVVANASTTTIVIGDPVTLFGTGATTYVWDNGISNNSPFNPTATTTYNVTGTDGNGCEASASITITVLIPEINVFVGADNTGTAITDDQVTEIDFGSLVEGSDITQTFTIENTGTSDLNISNLVAADADYAVTSTLTVVSPGISETFNITLSGTNVGTFNSSVSIFSDDPDESVFTFPITGTILADNHPPDFSYIFYLDENAENNRLVGTIVGTDPQNDPITYSIISGNTSGAFAIGSSSGDITVAATEVLDFETTPMFSLVIEANDGQGGVTLVSITIHLHDIDENVLGFEEEAGIHVYPNPAEEMLFIELDGWSTGEVELMMFTISGNLVFKDSGIAARSNVPLELHLEDFRPGIYVLKIQREGEVTTKNILVK